MYDALLARLVAWGWIDAGGWLVRGGVLMLPILACSVVALAALCDRVRALRPSVVLEPAVDDLVRLVREGSFQQALALTDARPGALGRIYRVAYDHVCLPRDLLAEAVRDAGRREVQRLERHASLLATVAGVSPLLGLLGTVLGMIVAFDALNASGAARAPELAGGISQALITTGAGLSVAIPAYLAHHWVLARVDRLANALEEATVELVAALGASRLRAGVPLGDRDVDDADDPFLGMLGRS